jgi:hypothetical protein
MAEPTLTQTFLKLQQEVGFYLSWGSDDTAWTTAQTALIKDIVNSGLRQFLLPPAANGIVSHRWSFLQAHAGTIALSTGDDDMALPDDWGGGTRMFHWAIGEAKKPIPVIPLAEFLSIASVKDSSGTPITAAIRPLTFAPATGQRYEVLFHPQPDSGVNAKVLNFTYSVDLDKLGTSGHFTPGGAAHSETLLESCLAVAELRVDDETGVHNARFMERLAASIEYDKNNIVPMATTWPEGIDDPSDNSLTFEQLCREVGKALNFGRNQDAWTTDQREEIYSTVNRGYRRFLQPDEGHAWAFLTQEGSLSLANTVSDYDMPADFGGIIDGQIHF